MHHAKALVPARKLIQDSSCAILRAVIHSDDFEVRVIDGRKGGERPGQLLFFIPCGKNQRNVRAISIGSGKKILDPGQANGAVRRPQSMEDPEERYQSEERQSDSVLDFPRQNWCQTLASVILSIA